MKNGVQIWRTIKCRLHGEGDQIAPEQLALVAEHLATGVAQHHPALKGNLSCTEWKERPGTGCARWDKQGDTVTSIDDKSGAVRAKIIKTAPGNAEKLAP